MQEELVVLSVLIKINRFRRHKNKRVFQQPSELKKQGQGFVTLTKREVTSTSAPDLQSQKFPRGKLLRLARLCRRFSLQN